MLRQFGETLILQKRLTGLGSQGLIRFVISPMAMMVYFSIYKEKGGWTATVSATLASLKDCR